MNVIPMAFLNTMLCLVYLHHDNIYFLYENISKFHYEIGRDFGVKLVGPFVSIQLRSVYKYLYYFGWEQRNRFERFCLRFGLIPKQFVLIKVRKRK